MGCWWLEADFFVGIWRELDFFSFFFRPGDVFLGSGGVWYVGLVIGRAVGGLLVACGAFFCREMVGAGFFSWAWRGRFGLWRRLVCWSGVRDGCGRAVGGLWQIFFVENLRGAGFFLSSGEAGMGSGGVWYVGLVIGMVVDGLLVAGGGFFCRKMVGLDFFLGPGEAGLGSGWVWYV